MDPSHAEFVGSGKKYFDPDASDESEQQFSSSLESPRPAARFVVDSGEDKISTAAEDPGPSPQSRVEHAEAARDLGATSGRSLSPPTRDWRQEVSAKVRSYHSRRQPKDRYPSLRLPFNSARWIESRPSQAVPRPASPPIPDPPQPAPVSERPSGRLLEFPRPPTVPPPARRDELAEAVERPRIVEVPEIVPSPPAMGGILIEPEEKPEPEPRAGIDRPLETICLKRRFAAGALDFLVVLASLAGSGYIFFRCNQSLPDWRVEAKLAFAFIAFFWPVYQYLFLVFSGTTPGLRLLRLEVVGFDGRRVGRKRRRRRTLLALLSSAFLGIGYLWCLFDEDRLSWHDRVTRTHLGPRSPMS